MRFRAGYFVPQPNRTMIACTVEAWAARNQLGRPAPSQPAHRTPPTTPHTRHTHQGAVNTEGPAGVGRVARQVSSDQGRGCIAEIPIPGGREGAVAQPHGGKRDAQRAGEARGFDHGAVGSRGRGRGLVGCWDACGLRAAHAQRRQACTTAGAACQEAACWPVATCAARAARCVRCTRAQRCRRPG